MRPVLRPRPLLLLALTAGASWYGMMVVHESGHVLAAWITGGRVARVVLDPLSFSRTELAANPHPVLVAAAGAAWGCALPLAAWLITRAAKLPLAFLLRAFAGFCLLTNGAYLATAAIAPVGDADDLLRLGVPLWALVAPGLAAMLAGLALWNGLAPHFGFSGRPIARGALAATSTSLGVLLLGMTLWTHVL